MSPNFWSDEERWFVPRTLGYSLNLKHVARHFGWIKSPPKSLKAQEEAAAVGNLTKSVETREQRLRRQIESSKYEEHE
jgi:hypothetical protein